MKKTVKVKIVTNKEELHAVSEDVKQNEIKALNNLLAINITLIGEKASGLSAVQVGMNKRACIVKIANKLKVMHNPTITWKSEEAIKGREKCLSVPNRAFEVERSKAIKVEYTDSKGVIVTEEFINRDARVVQHEIDHMNGVTIEDIGTELKE